MLNIQIKGEFIDLQPGEEVVLSLAAGKLGQLETRQGISSYEVTVPLTQKFQRLTGFDGTTTGAESVVNTRIPANICRGISVIQKGFIQISRYDTKNRTATLNFFAGNVNWFEVFKGLNLRELDLTKEVTSYSAGSFIGRGDAEYTDGIAFPFVDMGLIDQRDQAVENFYGILEFYPAVYRKYVLEQAASQNGYILTGSLMNSQKFARDVVMWDGESTSVSKASKDAYKMTVNAERSADSDTGPLNGFLNIEDDAQGQTLYDVNTINASAANDTITVNRSAKVRLNFQIDFNFFDLGFTNVAFITIESTQTTFTDSQKVNIFETLVPGSRQSEDFSFIRNFSLDIIMTPDDSLKFNYLVGISNPTVRTRYRQQVTIKTELIEAMPIANAFLAPQDLLPDLTVAELFKEVAIDYAGLIQYNPDTQAIIFNTFNDLKSNVNRAVNWTNKLDSIEGYSLDFVEGVTDYGQSNFFRRNNGIGDGSLTIDNDFLTPDNDIFESEFEGSENVNRYALALASIPKYFIDSEDVDVNNIADDGNGILAVSLDDVNDFEQFDLVTFDGDIESTYPATYQVARVDNDANEIIINATYISVSVGNSSLKQIEADEIGNRVLLLEQLDVSDITDQDINIEGQAIKTVKVGTYKVSNIGEAQTETDSLAYASSGQVNEDQTQAYILTEAYRVASEMLNKNSYLRANFLLDDSDISNLDFAVPVYLGNAGLQGYYYLDEIEEYNGMRALCNLIKLD